MTLWQYLTVLLKGHVLIAWHYSTVLLTVSFFDSMTLLDSFIDSVIFWQYDITYLTLLMTGSYFDSMTLLGIFTDIVIFWQFDTTYPTVLLTVSYFDSMILLDSSTDSVIFWQCDITYLTVLLTESYFDSMTVQAPHPPSPQPNLVPVNFTVQQWRKSNTRFHVRWLIFFSWCSWFIIRKPKTKTSHLQNNFLHPENYC